jgi:uncharacterized protein YecE (DUF72 family)
MIVVACSGFPVPVSRYFRSFEAVEIVDTEIGVPGEGTLRRWLREAPRGFVFSLLAPQSLAASGFAKSRENKEVLEGLGEFATALGARAIVLRGPEDFKPGKATQSTLYAFLGQAPKKLPTLVVDLPGWTAAQIEGAARGRAIAARDPLRDEPMPDGDLVYFRLPGPAGRRSRYDEPSLDRIAQAARKSTADTTMIVFANVDMETNANALRERLRKRR